MAKIKKYTIDDTIPDGGEHLVSPYGNVLIKEYLKSSQLSLLLSVKEMVGRWVSGYDGYMTMMSNKKNYDKGVAARELKRNLQSLLDEEINKIKELN